MVNCHYTLGEYMLDNGVELPENEKWINGFEGSYAISTKGDVVSYKNKKPLILKGGVTNDKKRSADNGYRIVTLSTKGERKTKVFKCHRLVAEYFIPNPENKPCVNHIDGDKLNNDITNLEWVTYSENTVHAYSTGLTKPNFADHSEKIDNFINNGEPSGYSPIYLKGLLTSKDLERNGLPGELTLVNFVYRGRSIRDTWYDNCKIYKMLEEGYRLSEISKVTGKTIGHISRIKGKQIHVEGYEIYKNYLTEDEKSDILIVRKINERKKLLNLKEIGPCEFCGDMMPEERSHKRFCSNSCYHKFNKKRLN